MKFSFRLICQPGVSFISSVSLYQLERNICFHVCINWLHAVIIQAWVSMTLAISQIPFNVQSSNIRSVTISFFSEHYRSYSYQVMFYEMYCLLQRINLVGVKLDEFLKCNLLFFYYAILRCHNKYEWTLFLLYLSNKFCKKCNRFLNCSGSVITKWPMNVTRAMIITEMGVHV